MTKLPEAIEALTRVADAQLAAVREEMRRRDRREAAERFASPEFQAELATHRRPLRRISARAFIRAAPWVYADAFQTEVPPEYYVQVADGTMVVACPCGTDHEVGALGYPAGAPCGRYFLYDGVAMKVWGGPPPAEGPRTEGEDRLES